MAPYACEKPPYRMALAVNAVTGGEHEASMVGCAERDRAGVVAFVPHR